MRKPFDAFFLLGIGCGGSAGLLKFGDKEVRDGVAGDILDDSYYNVEDVCMGAATDVNTALTRESLCSRLLVVFKI